MNQTRNLVVILGDQLNADSAALDDFDPNQDRIWMAEVSEESTHVQSHKARIALFLSAMRHFREDMRKRGFPIDYRQLDDRGNQQSLVAELGSAAKRHLPEQIVMVEPGEWRLRNSVTELVRELPAQLQLREDRHFLCSHEQFAQHARGRKQLRLEYFYRELRRKSGLLMDGDSPVGGSWNYDKQNRGSFGKRGPEDLPTPRSFRPDKITREVIKLVEGTFASHPGSLKHFDWPVTRRQALQALEDFIQHRLPRFGQFQDAMWTNEPLLYHSRLSAALNLKLLGPLEVCQEAEAAYRGSHAPLNSVEGFIRQILGWREFVRGVYWMHMPDYLNRNALAANLPLPGLYWTAETEMNCLSQAIGQTLEFGYAHHIQRLMITGLFVLLLGVDPKQVHEWYLAVYVDAVEWVELPNSLGMSQFADGGVMASKPYIASGKYVQRMSNYCSGCRFDPAAATGDSACPFTTLYWDFLIRHQQRLEGNNRMTMQLKNLQRKSESELHRIRTQADRLRVSMTSQPAK